MDINYFRPQRVGPESIIENVIASKIPYLFPINKKNIWAAASLPVGAGLPDLIIVHVEPQVFALSQVEILDTQVLAYLRAVSKAHLETIIKKTGRSRLTVIRCLDDLAKVKVVSKQSDIFSLLPIWRDILPEIITIEVKIKDWKKAVIQAGRNRIFAHKSYIALPNQLAERIRIDPIFNQLGIGLLSVDTNHNVDIIRRARHFRPRVWNYYYHIASKIAVHKGD